MRAGSLFSGYGGLTLAVEEVFGATTAWHCEVEPAPSKILAERWLGVPNLGDITKVDWSSVEPVDIIDGGSPCQDVSSAGKRAGMRAGTRSGLWASMCDAIQIIRPRFVVWENVRGVTSAEADSALEPCPGCVGDGDDGPVLRALGRVLGDLADLGYDASWQGLRAADVGAPHGRYRIFVVATDAERVGRDGWASDARRGAVERTAAGRSGALVAADARGGSLAGAAAARDGLRLAAERGDRTPADAAGDGRDERRPEAARLVGRPDAAERSGAAPADPLGLIAERRRGDGDVARPSRAGQADGGQRQRDGDAADDRGAATPDTDNDAARAGRESRNARGREGESAQRRRVDWGQYEPAIRRWESVLGRVAPAPTETGPKGAQRLSPAFVEWMMGLPAGWVTDVPISRNDQLKALGNGVVPQQAAAAIRKALHVQAVAA